MSGFLRDEGYEVKMFNLLDMENSDAWNCLSEIEHDKDLVDSCDDYELRVVKDVTQSVVDALRANENLKNNT